MKVAVSAEKAGMDSPVDPRFGRARWFVVVDTDTMAFESLENHQNLNLPQGAGLQAGKTVADAGATVLLTGNCGPKAFMLLESAGVQVITGVGGTVKEAVEGWLDGRFQAAKGPNVEGHWS